MKTFFLKGVAAWLPMVVIGVGNGVLRQATYGKAMSPLAAHQLSTLTGVLLVAVYIWLIYPRLDLDFAGEAVALGGFWVVLTVLFEFGFGHYVVGHDWSVLLADYNLVRGRLWSLFLICTGALPWIVYKIRG